MNLSTHFSFEELTLSDTAVRAGIDNTPSGQLMPNLVRLAAGLELVRAALGSFCLCTCFSKPQRIVLSYRKDRLRRVSSRKALACGRFPDRAESGMRPWAVCDDCGERQIRPDKPGAALGSHRDGFR